MNPEWIKKTTEVTTTLELVPADEFKQLMEKPHVFVDEVAELKKTVDKVLDKVKSLEVQLSRTEDELRYRTNYLKQALERVNTRERERHEMEREILVCAICGRPGCGCPERVPMREYQGMYPDVGTTMSFIYQQY